MEITGALVELEGETTYTHEDEKDDRNKLIHAIASLRIEIDRVVAQSCLLRDATWCDYWSAAHGFTPRRIHGPDFVRTSMTQHWATNSMNYRPNILGFGVDAARALSVRSSTLTTGNMLLHRETKRRLSVAGVDSGLMPSSDDYTDAVIEHSLVAACGSRI